MSDIVCWKAWQSDHKMLEVLYCLQKGCTFSSFFLLIITLLCMSVFLQSTNLECLMLVWLLVLHEKINNFAHLMLYINAGAVRVATRGVYVKRFLVWYRNKLVLLSDNGSGVLLSTAGARLPNRTRAGLCFKLLCVSLRQITCAWCAI